MRERGLNASGGKPLIKEIETVAARLFNTHITVIDNARVHPKESSLTMDTRPYTGMDSYPGQRCSALVAVISMENGLQPGCLLPQSMPAVEKPIQAADMEIGFFWHGEKGVWNVSFLIGVS
jgi:hypothetical protein